MSALLYIMTGFLVRADGWGSVGRWKRLSDAFNVFSCSALFALLCAFIMPPLTALCAGLAFLIWRLPGFHAWNDWVNMYWRGWWTSAIGFTALSYVVYGHPCYGLLSVPFAAIYTLIYSGAYNWLPNKFFVFNRHVWVEHASGWVFGAFILMIIRGA